MTDDMMLKILENQEKHGAAISALDAKLTAHFDYSTQEISRLALREEAISTELHKAQGAIHLGAILMTTGLTVLGLVIAALRLWRFP